MNFTDIFEDNVLKQIEADKDCNQIFLYIVNFSNCYKSITKFWNYLSDEEENKAKSYYTTELCDKYIISHGILRYILGYYTRQPPREIEFIRNDYGKPFLKNHNVQFNMTHSYDIVGYVISLKYKVGIDIELRNNNSDIQDLGDAIFTPTEYKILQ